jgi:hypothetical protein
MKGLADMKRNNPEKLKITRKRERLGKCRNHLNRDMFYSASQAFLSFELLANNISRQD